MRRQSNHWTDFLVSIPQGEPPAHSGITVVEMIHSPPSLYRALSPEFQHPAGSFPTYV